MVIIQNTIKSTIIPSNKWLQVTTNKILASLKRLAIIKASELNSDIVVRIVDIDEITKLNYKYRNKNSPTNILSFPNTTINDIPVQIQTQLSPSLGDLVICFAIALNEAKKANKTTTQHLTHLLIHGILHLLTYDHITDNDAKQMQNIETKVLTELGIANPY